MKKELNFDDLVFETRNKEYGAYVLRKNYNTNVAYSILIAMTIVGTAVIMPFLNAKAMDNRIKGNERFVEIKMENLDQPNDIVAPPPLAPPPPADVVQQVKYVPPVVVDSVKPEENIFMTVDEAQVEVQNEEAVEVVETVKEEVKEEEEPEVFVVVEEMPVFPGGIGELMRYISDHLNYPELAKENNIQGKIIVRFCVTPTGGISKVSLLRGVDPELDAEAIRVVKSLPQFKPGKQLGRPVPVWFTVPIIFQLK